jgi:hypothetical protein
LLLSHPGNLCHDTFGLLNSVDIIVIHSKFKYTTKSASPSDLGLICFLPSGGI